MIELDCTSIDKFMKNGALGVDLAFEKISEYDSYISKKNHFMKGNKVKPKERDYWNYILYANPDDINPSPTTIGIICFIERFKEYSGVLEIPLRSFLNNKCEIISQSLQEQHKIQTDMIQLAKKYYKEQLSAIEMSIEFKCNIHETEIISVFPYDIVATAYLNNQRVYLEKRLRNDLKAYNLENFELNCQKSMHLIDMISE